MSEVTYYIEGLFRQANAALARAYLGITGGGGTLPVGGTVGQVLEKNSNVNFDVSWQTPAAGGSGRYATMAKFGGF